MILIDKIMLVIFLATCVQVAHAAIKAYFPKDKK